MQELPETAEWLAGVALNIGSGGNPQPPIQYRK